MIPPRLPILATPMPERASLDDPTMAASTAAVLAAPPPERTTPAPYTRMGVPDPFEHRRPLTLRVPPEGTAPQR